jgi:DNA-binding response OmpR family regulator
LSEHAVDILLVEDDRRLADLTAEYFEQNGFSVAIESRGDQALSHFARIKPRVVLLDLMLPGTDGLTICRELRETFDGPILIFTARDSDIDQIIGLEAGADDYVTKPVDPMVLLARTRALLRRVESFDNPAQSGGDIILGGLRISPSAQQVILDGRHVRAVAVTRKARRHGTEPRRYFPQPARYRLRRPGPLDRRARLQAAAQTRGLGDRASADQDRLG